MLSKRVIVVGSAAVDEQISAEGSVRTQLGGVVAYGGAAFVTEGLSALAVCNLDARFGAPMRRALGRMGVEVSAGTSMSSTAFENTLLADGGRRQRVLGIANPISAELVSAALEGIEGAHVHLGPLHGADLAAEALAVIAANASLVTLDVQGFVRRGEVGPVCAEATPLLEAALTAAHVVKADEAELEVMLEAYSFDPDELLARFDIDELVVTSGSAGGYVMARNGDRSHYAAAPAAPAGDTTGAGDVFFAAYVAARLHRGVASREAAAHAAVVAARHVAGGLLREGDLDLTLEEHDGSG